LKILLNTYINEFRRRRRKPTIIDVELSEAVLESASVASATTPESQLLEQLLDIEIQQALDALPVEFRLVVWLADVEELSYAEISEITECASGTVASRLYRGHALLREHLRQFARRRGLIRE
jgi:RNA polymerase sigma-70 factor (ECF subfamily)